MVMHHETFGSPTMVGKLLSDFTTTPSCYLGTFDGDHIKFGESSWPLNRNAQHERDYPGFQLWAIVPCQNPKLLESRFIAEMKRYKADYPDLNDVSKRREVIAGIDPAEAERVMRRIANGVDEETASIELEKHRVTTTADADVKKHAVAVDTQYKFAERLLEMGRVDEAMRIMERLGSAPVSPRCRSPYRTRSTIEIAALSPPDSDADTANETALPLVPPPPASGDGDVARYLTETVDFSPPFKVDTTKGSYWWLTIAEMTARYKSLRGKSKDLDTRAKIKTAMKDNHGVKMTRLAPVVDGKQKFPGEGFRNVRWK